MGRPFFTPNSSGAPLNGTRDLQLMPFFLYSSGWFLIPFFFGHRGLKQYVTFASMKVALGGRY